MKGTAGRRRVGVISDTHDLLRPEALRALRGMQIVISGHSHQPRKETRDGVLYFNPGSAGPRRFTLPISMGRLQVVGHRVRATLVDLGPGRRLG